MSPARPAPRSARAVVLPAVLLAVALASLASPAWPLRVVALAEVVGAAVGARALLRRPRVGVLGRSWASLAPWGTVGVVAGLAPVALLRSGVAGDGRGGVVGYLLVAAVVLLGTSTLVPLMVDRAVMRAVRSTGQPWVDAAMVSLGTAVVVTLAVRAAPGLGLAPAGTANLVLVLLVLSVAVWLRGTRDSADPAVRRLNTATLVLLVQEAVFLLTPPSAEVLPVLTACGSALGALLLVQGGCRLQVFPPPGRTPVFRPRPGSARVLMTAPFAVSVPVTGVLSKVLPGASIPAPLLWGAVAAMTVLALVRAHSLVSAAEADAERDALTGLHDRRGFVRAAGTDEHLLAGDARVCLVDLDGFKLVNDRRGHAAGDALLRAIADRLRERLPVGSVVGRLGGDELVALVHAASGPEAARRVLDVFAEPFELGAAHGALVAAASVGVADHSGHAGVDEVLKRADVAMYTAKHEGRGRWVAWAPEQHEKVLGAPVMLEELRTLLGRPSGPSGPAHGAGPLPPEDPGRLVLHYQPVVDLVTGLPSGMECFVRWLHPRRGTVAPDDFLPLVESAGLGADVDRWVLHTALEQVACWDAAGALPSMRRVGVNLGVSSMRSPTLVADVEAALDASGCGPERLVLEITEHDELPFDPAAAQRLLHLRGRGVSVALDDFGNGYSSVGYLRRWPVDTIKIDRSLLPLAGAEGAFAAIDDPLELLDGVVALAAALGHDVVAEGVETAEDDRAVRAVGVRYGQGWLYARPMDAEHLTAWWAQRLPALPGPGGDGAGAAGATGQPSGVGERAGAVAP